MVKAKPTQRKETDLKDTKCCLEEDLSNTQNTAE